MIVPVDQLQWQVCEGWHPPGGASGLEGLCLEGTTSLFLRGRYGKHERERR